MMDKRRFKGYLVLAVVFVLGAVVGGAASHAYAKRHLFDRFEQEGPKFAQRYRERALIRKLDLDDAQAASLREVFARHDNKLRELSETTLRECGAPLQAQREQLDGEIRALLQPEQLQRFERMLERRQRKMKGPGFGPPH